LEDNFWVLDLAGQNELILGFIAGLDPTTASFRGQLRQLAEFPVMRGIRLRPAELKNLSAAVLDNLALVRDLRLSVDVLAHPDDGAAILNLADLYPDLPIVVNHLCHLAIDGRPPTPAQRSLLEALGARANIYCKVSAIQERSVGAAGRNDLEHYRPMLDGLWHDFGENRLVYGSNWPVCERAGSYASQFSIVRSYFASKGEGAARKFLGENAQQAYGLAEKSAASSPGQTPAL
jgi:L-fuconolactonase